MTCVGELKLTFPAGNAVPPCDTRLTVVVASKPRPVRVRVVSAAVPDRVGLTVVSKTPRFGCR